MIIQSYFPLKKLPEGILSIAIWSKLTKPSTTTTIEQWLPPVNWHQPTLHLLKIFRSSANNNIFLFWKNPFYIIIWKRIRNWSWNATFDSFKYRMNSRVSIFFYKERVSDVNWSVRKTYLFFVTPTVRLRSGNLIGRLRSYF